MNKQLSLHEAFDAMRLFLEKYYDETGSDDVACLLSSIQYLEDGDTADAAMWHEWLECVAKSVAANKNMMN